LGYPRGGSIGPDRVRRLSQSNDFMEMVGHELEIVSFNMGISFRETLPYLLDNLTRVTRMQSTFDDVS
jgi:hypothetical protein